MGGYTWSVCTYSNVPNAVHACIWSARCGSASQHPGSAPTAAPRHLKITPPSTKAWRLSLQHSASTCCSSNCCGRTGRRTTPATTPYAPTSRLRSIPDVSRTDALPHYPTTPIAPRAPRIDFLGTHAHHRAGSWANAPGTPRPRGGDVMVTDTQRELTQACEHQRAALQRVHGAASRLRRVLADGSAP